ncbi:MAG TPA: hypothetical protein DEG92_02765 [Rikenellaceae bacterium]|nr:hypothetical protein [Rikenellaceae bacterium]
MNNEKKSKRGKPPDVAVDDPIKHGNMLARIKESLGLELTIYNKTFGYHKDTISGYINVNPPLSHKNIIRICRYLRTCDEKFISSAKKELIEPYLKEFEADTIHYTESVLLNIKNKSQESRFTIVTSDIETCHRPDFFAPQLIIDGNRSNEIHKPTVISKFDPANNLPIGYYPFVGKQNILSQLLVYLSPSCKELSCGIRGKGGTGKTTLAIEAARACKEENYFEAIVLYAVEDGASNINDIFSTIVEILAPIIPENVDFETDNYKIASYLLDKVRTLIIIDDIDILNDFDQLLLINFIHAPNKLLATSRHRLHLANNIVLD